MFFAFDYKNNKIEIDEAHSNQEYYCPSCGAPLIIKRGNQRLHHFAHKGGHQCSDAWEANRSYDISLWHKTWQQLFPRENCEVTIKMGEISHRADVLISNTIIEFQHSIMSPKAFEDRNNYYQNLGYKVIWLFDISDLVESGQISFSETKNGIIAEWGNPQKAFKEHSFFDSNIDLFFQISNQDDNCIVRVLQTSDLGFERFIVSKQMTKEDFLSYVGVNNGNCEKPFMPDYSYSDDYYSFKEKYHIELDPMQERALFAVNGPVLLLAVPGSGKTTVLVDRLGYMVFVKGIKPETILAITYNKKASEEMKSRFSDTFGKDIGDHISFRTINALSNEIYTKNVERIGQTKRTLCTDNNGLLRQIYNACNGAWPSENEIKEFASYITYIKNMQLSAEEICMLNTDLPNLPTMYSNYQEKLAKSALMDFDDQMVFAKDILCNCPEVLKKLREKYKYICVDEAQDTSKIQHDIIKLLADGNNLFMVGDEDQSIYGYRAAYPQALLNFRFEYRNPYILRMEKNYRSTSQITDIAQKFIAKNKGRYTKKMTSNRGPGENVILQECSTRENQYKYLLDVAKNSKTETAFLYRNNESSIVLTDLLLRSGIDFSLKKPQMDFFDMKVPKEILAFLRLSVDPFDYNSLEQVYNKGILYMRSQQIEYAIRNVKKKHISVFDALDEQMEYVKYDYRDRAKNFRDFINRLSKANAKSAIDMIVSEGYGKHLGDNHGDLAKLDTLKMLAQSENDIKSFLYRMDYLRDILHKDNDGKTDSPIILSTIHSSKGLEYDSVYILDIYDGYFPSSNPELFFRSKDYANGEQEERRLFYVGMTRAKNRLTIIKIQDRKQSYVDELFPPESACINNDVEDLYTSNLRQMDLSNAIRRAEEEQHKKNMKKAATVSSKFLKSVQAIAIQNEKKNTDIKRIEFEKERGLSEVQDCLNDQTEKAIDSFGRRWIVCEVCGEIKEEDDFISYGGEGKMNLGICRDCSRKSTYIKE